jgi:hypothetical protein
MLLVRQMGTPNGIGRQNFYGDDRSVVPSAVQLAYCLPPPQLLSRFRKSKRQCWLNSHWHYRRHSTEYRHLNGQRRLSSGPYMEFVRIHYSKILRTCLNGFGVCKAHGHTNAAVKVICKLVITRKLALVQRGKKKFCWHQIINYQQEKLSSTTIPGHYGTAV